MPAPGSICRPVSHQIVPSQLTKLSDVLARAIVPLDRLSTLSSLNNTDSDHHAAQPATTPSPRRRAMGKSSLGHFE